MLLFIILFALFIPLHETVHWINAEFFNPYFEPVQMHFLDEITGYVSKNSNCLIIASVEMKETFLNAAKEEPPYFRIIDELSAYSIQSISALLLAFIIAFNRLPKLPKLRKHS